MWHGEKGDKDAAPSEVRNMDGESNPFENHDKSKRAKRDLDKRQDLLNEYRRLNKNSVIKDNRLGESSSKLSEEDKMKLRYMREQRDRARAMLEEKD